MFYSNLLILIEYARNTNKFIYWVLVIPSNSMVGERKAIGKRKYVIFYKIKTGY